MLTYTEAYNKIIEAYFRDEIKPLDSSFCFCGTLCNNSRDWFSGSWLSNKPHSPHSGYSGEELMKLEGALFHGIYKVWSMWDHEDQDNPLFEESLFAGMCAALDVLKEIHKSRGEDVDTVPVFTKRKLANV